MLCFHDQFVFMFGCRVGDERIQFAVRCGSPAYCGFRVRAVFMYVLSFVPPVEAKRWQAIARQNRIALTVVFVTRPVLPRATELPQCDLRSRNPTHETCVMERLCD